MNILLMHTHDTGKYISPYGFHVPTGHLMEFAKDAMVFEAMFCASPTCSPSRGGYDDIPVFPLQRTERPVPEGA